MFVVERIHERAVQSPDRLAIVFNGAAVSYGQFWARIAARRREFQALDLAPEGVVVLWVGNLYEGWILTLALRSLGLTTTAIGLEAQAALFTDMSCLVTLARERKPAIDLPVGAVRVDVDIPDVEGQAPGDYEPVDAPGGHILLTSATTGQHKKVLSQGGAKREAIDARQARYAALGPGFTMVGPDTVKVIFDLGLWTGAGYGRPIEVWSLGGAVVWQEAPHFHRALEWPGITHVVATPYYLSQLMAQPRIPYLPNLQVMVTAGSVSRPLFEEVRRRLTPRMVISLAATEVGGWARTVVETDEDLRWYRLDPEREVEVVDEEGAPLPDGELGRVRVRQREGGVTGYVDDPTTTAAVFGDGWFYPGDLGVLDGKGRLSLYGRTSDIIHLMGNKIPAEPLERKLLEALGADAVCLLTVPAAEGGEALHVFIESRKIQTREALTAAAQATLFGFPSVQFHKIAAMPRTALGKVRRMALAQWFHETQSEESARPGAVEG